MIFTSDSVADALIIRRGMILEEIFLWETEAQRLGT